MLEQSLSMGVLKGISTMAEKQKSLTLTKTKLADLDGEHRITFVASSGNEDRDYERVEISTFRLPLKGGGHIIVQDLPDRKSVV